MCKKPVGSSEHFTTCHFFQTGVYLLWLSYSYVGFLLPGNVFLKKIILKKLKEFILAGDYKSQIMNCHHFSKTFCLWLN